MGTGRVIAVIRIVDIQLRNPLIAIIQAFDSRVHGQHLHNAVVGIQKHQSISRGKGLNLRKRNDTYGIGKPPRPIFRNILVTAAKTPSIAVSHEYHLPDSRILSHKVHSRLHIQHPVFDGTALGICPRRSKTVFRQFHHRLKGKIVRPVHGENCNLTPL